MRIAHLSVIIIFALSVILTMTICDIKLSPSTFIQLLFTHSNSPLFWNILAWLCDWDFEPVGIASLSNNLWDILERPAHSRDGQ